MIYFLSVLQALFLRELSKKKNHILKKPWYKKDPWYQTIGR
jgi:hypothetical protein